jgi:hypothetical protein
VNGGQDILSWIISVSSATMLYDSLLRGPRPEFMHSQDMISHGSELKIHLTNGWTFGDIDPKRIGILRFCGGTHAFNFDQRYIRLVAFVRRTKKVHSERHATTSTMTRPQDDDIDFNLWIPQNRNVVPPGYYMLFLVSKLGQELSGTSSIGHIIRIC